MLSHDVASGTELAPALHAASALIRLALEEAGQLHAQACIRAGAYLCAQTTVLIQAVTDLELTARCVVLQTDDDRDLWLFVRAHGGQAGLSLKRHVQATGLSMGVPSQALLDWSNEAGTQSVDGGVRALRLCQTSQRAARTAARGLLAAVQDNPLLDRPA